MNNNLKIYKNTIIYSFYWIIHGILLMIIFNFDKLKIFNWINSYKHEFITLVLSYLTYLGHAYIFIFGMIFVIYKKKYIIPLTISCIISVLIVSIMKKYLFIHYIRPSIIDNAININNYIFNIQYNSSFPSGHAIVAFSFWNIINFILIDINIYITSYLFILSSLISYSRIYLSHHFYIDIYIGSIIGSIISIFSWYLSSLIIKNTQSRT
ncbi:MAG: phosphatase PAP2 family protein [Bacteroides sp.]|nr:MAG: phosphatase PAP2 family protein [Bacteroides sp.]